MKNKNVRFNFIDALIIIIVLALVGYIVYGLVSGKTLSGIRDDYTDSEATIELEVGNVYSELKNTVKIGDTIYDKSSGKEIGVISDVSYGECYRAVSDGESGQTVLIKIDGKMTVNIVVKASVQYKENQIYLNGNRIVIGDELSFISRSFSGCGKINLISKQNEVE